MITCAQPNEHSVQALILVGMTANGYLLNGSCRPIATSAPASMAAAWKIAPGYCLEVVDEIAQAIGADRIGVRYLRAAYFVT